MKRIHTTPDDHSPACYREGTGDKNIWRSINYFNEYKLPIDMQGLRVLDIGAHIGSFAYACAKRGAIVRSFEIDSENCELYDKNLKGFDASVSHLAVSGKDRVPVFFSGYSNLETRSGTEINTGGGNIYTGEKTDTGLRSTPLDDIVKENFVPDLLKLDCEGSEWPILFNSECISQIPEIVGEFHESEGLFADAEFKFATGWQEVGITALRDFLLNIDPAGNFTFKYSDKSEHGSLGLFHWSKSQ